ncbi:hypothetical protein U5640_22870 [Streptomyces sp. SS7]|uniref:hypothetical protein n=1 Tax=Streptomyces sp. SS7 TaxID=3108485 RepID=UPI0030EED531
MEALVPEMTAFATHVYEEEPGTLPHRVEFSHRVGVETLLSRLRDMGKPYPLTGGGIALKWRDMSDPYLKRQQEIQDRGEA